MMSDSRLAAAGAELTVLLKDNAVKLIGVMNDQFVGSSLRFAR
jgi:hypothetical protein